MRSVTSSHSDTMFEKVHRHVLNEVATSDAQYKQQSASMHSAIGFNGINGEVRKGNSEKKYAMRYKTAGERFKQQESDLAMLRCTQSTMSWSSAHDQESRSPTILQSSMVDSFPKSGQFSTHKGNTSRTYLAEELDRYSSCSTSKLRIGSTIAANPMSKSDLSDEDLFGNYAETDLDQPTNYSLRYAEHTSDEDERQTSGYVADTEREVAATSYAASFKSSGGSSSFDDRTFTRKSSKDDDSRRSAGKSKEKRVPVEETASGAEGGDDWQIKDQCSRTVEYDDFEGQCDETKVFNYEGTYSFWRNDHWNLNFYYF